MKKPLVWGFFWDDCWHYRLAHQQTAARSDHDWIEVVWDYNQ